MLIGALIGTGMIFGLMGLLLYLTRRGIKTYPGQGESPYKRRGRLKAARKRERRRYRF